MDQSAVMTEALLVVLLYLSLGLARMEVEREVSKSVRRYCECRFGVEARNLYIRLPQPELSGPSEYHMVEKESSAYKTSPRSSMLEYHSWQPAQGFVLARFE